MDDNQTVTMPTTKGDARLDQLWHALEAETAALTARINHDIDDLARRVATLETLRTEIDDDEASRLCLSKELRNGDGDGQRDGEDPL
jgi:hypothetical protein